MNVIPPPDLRMDLAARAESLIRGVNALGQLLEARLISAAQHDQMRDEALRAFLGTGEEV